MEKGWGIEGTVEPMFSITAYQCESLSVFIWAIPLFSFRHFLHDLGSGIRSICFVLIHYFRQLSDDVAVVRPLCWLDRSRKVFDYRLLKTYGLLIFFMSFYSSVCQQVNHKSRACAVFGNCSHKYRLTVLGLLYSKRWPLSVVWVCV